MTAADELETRLREELDRLTVEYRAKARPIVDHLVELELMKPPKLSIIALDELREPRSPRDEVLREVRDCLRDLEDMKEQKLTSLDRRGYSRDAMLEFMQKIESALLVKEKCDGKANHS